MYALEMLAEGGLGGGVLQPLGPAPIYLGRAPQNDIVVSDPTVSARHLAVWVADGRVFVEDLGSRNGTHVLGKRIAGVVRVLPDDEVRAGEGTPFRIVVTSLSTGPNVTWTLEDVTSSVRYPVRSDRFRIGGDQRDDVVVPGLPPRAAVLLFHPNGEIWLGVDDDERELDPAQPFEVSGRPFLLRYENGPVGATVEREETRYPYTLFAELEAAGGPYAEIEDVHTGVKHRLTGETRAVLLYLLAQKRLADEAAGVSDDEAGWCDDRDVMVGIWGKSGADAPLSKLNTLVCRVRQELREVGFDPWFVEKRRGATRARAREVRTTRPT